MALKSYKQTLNEISPKLIGAFVDKARASITSLSADKVANLPKIIKRSKGIAAAKKRPLEFYSKPPTIPVPLEVAVEKFSTDKQLAALYKKYAGPLERAIAHDKSRHRLMPEYQNPEGLLRVIASSDFSPKKIYMEFMAKTYANREWKIEDLTRVQSDLGMFQNLKPRIPNKDINSYPNLNALYDAIAVAETVKASETSAIKAISANMAAKLIKAKGTDVLIDNEHLKILRLKNFGAVKQYCAGTKWCFSGKNSYDVFTEYRGGLYVIITKINGRIRKFAVHARTNQFMNERDTKIGKDDLRALRKMPGFDRIEKIYLSGISKFDDDNWNDPLNNLLDYAMLAGERIPFLEKQILNPKVYPKGNRYDYMADSLSSYAQTIVKGPWKEAEPFIAKDATAAEEYAAYVLKGPFPLGEPAIVREGDGFHYAIEILKKPWPAAEAEFLRRSRNKQTGIYDIKQLLKYLLKIRKSRWPTVEKYITNPGLAGTSVLTLGKNTGRRNPARYEFEELRNKYFDKYVPKNESYIPFAIYEKTFAEIYHVKDKWFRVNGSRIAELSDNFHALVDGVYGPLYGGHASFASPTDVINSDFWTAIDVDDDPDADALIFGRKTLFGMKIRGIGHDHGAKSKSSLIAQLVYLLSKEGYWLEASDKLETILRAKGVPIVTDIELIRKMFPKDQIRVHSNGSYSRGTYKETMFGTPKNEKNQNNK